MEDRWGAFVRRFDAPLPATGSGALDGWTLAVKDCFEIAGVPITAGSRDYAEWRGLPTADSWAVAALRAVGARAVGTTKLHELAYGITGINRGQGTPENPAVPGAIPGGSSSGSAVAVAAGLARFALGSDTGGSIRAPAALCGIWGYRPTHGLLPLTGAVPLAPSFDTVGIMARNAPDLDAVLRALWASAPTGAPPDGPEITEVLIAIDAVERCSLVMQRAIEETASRLSSRRYRLRERRLDVMDEIREAQAPIQGAEAWSVHKDWIEAASPTIGDDVAALLRIGADRSATELIRATDERTRLVAAVGSIIGPSSALLFPAALGTAPALADFDDPARSLANRRGMLTLHNVATLGGFPAIAFPVQAPGETPLGAQLVGARGADQRILAVARAVE